ncbi:hypothetical protein [Thermopirellula anaerolimosa]
MNALFRGRRIMSTTGTLRGCAFGLIRSMLACCVATALATVPVLAEEGSGDVPAVPASATSGAAEESPPLDATIREQTIYVPYEKFRQVFEQDGRGVFLPYEKFRELWQAAQSALHPQVEASPPVNFLFRSASTELELGKQAVQGTMTLDVVVLTKGWHLIPLRMSDVSIRRASIGDAAADLIFEQGYFLLVYHEDSEPRDVQLALEFAKGIAHDSGERTVTFETPPVPVSRWHVHTPEEGVRIEVSPAATPPVPEVSGADPDANGTETATGDSDGGKKVGSEVTAYAAPGSSVTIGWTPTAEGAAGLEALASVQARVEVFVDVTQTRIQTQLDYSVSRAELTSLRIHLPKGCSVEGVFDPNVRRWTRSFPEDSPDVQQIDVELFEPVRKTQRLSVIYSVPTQTGKSTALPVIQPVGVGRHEGYVAVRLGEGLRGEISDSRALMQADPSELPAANRQQAWDWVFRYIAVPYQLALLVEPVSPRVTVDETVELHLTERALQLSIVGVFNIERAGIFQVNWAIPPGFEVARVQARAAENVPAVEIADWRVEGEAKDRLTINFRKRALGQATVEILLTRELPEAERLDRPMQPREWSLPLPRVAAESVERSTGRVTLFAPEYLQVEVKPVAGLHLISLSEIPPQPAAPDRPAGLAPMVAYAFTEAASTLDVKAQRRRPQLNLAQLLVMRIEDRVIRYDCTFFGDVQFSGIQEVRIDVPESVANKLRNQTPQIRETRLTPQPADTAPGFVAFGFSAATELLGEFTIRLTWEEPVAGDLDEGASLRVTVPHLQPRGADQAWGQIVVVKSENIEVREAGETSGLRPIDPQRELMRGRNMPEAAGAFEFTGTWSLALEALRYRIEPAKQAAIERALVRMVMTRGDRIAVQALYRIRSMQQRLAVALPPGAEPANEQRLNGRRFDLELAPEATRPKSVAPGRAVYYVPLAQTSPDEVAVLELRYQTAAQKPGLMIPEFPIDPDVQPLAPAIQRVYLSVYVPEEMRVLTRSGPWTEEFDWEMEPGRGLQPMVHASADPSSLIDWVTEGTDVQVGDFAVDGMGLVYSSIDPPSGVHGALKLRMCDYRLWNALLIAGGLIVGLLLLPLRWGTRLWILAWLTLAWCIAAVVFPIAAAQMADRTLFLVGVGVVVVWLFSDALRNRPKGPPGGFVPAKVTGEPPPTRGPLAAEMPPLPADSASALGGKREDAVLSAAVVMDDDDVVIEKRSSGHEETDAADPTSAKTNASETDPRQEGEQRHDQE